MRLFELSKQLRSVFGIIGLILITILVLWLLWVGARGIYNYISSQEQTNPDAFFGTISAPRLPKSDVDLTETKFQIDLPEGFLPQVPSELKVYPIPKPKGTLTSLNDTKETVKKLQFRDDPKKISEGIYSWIGTENKAKSIRMNIASGEFVYKYDIKKDPELIEGKFKVDETAIIKQAKRFLARMDSFPDDLEGGPTLINFYKQSGSKRKKVTSLSEANEVEIYFFRKALDEQYAIVQPNPDVSLIRVVMGANIFKERGVVEAEYSYWPFELNNYSLYPIKNSDQAWSEFQEGKASFVKGGKESYEEIFLENVELAYFATKSYQPYAQPIYIFTGSGISKTKLVSFVAYLPAIGNEYLK